MNSNKQSGQYDLPEFCLYDALSEKVLRREDIWSPLYTVVFFLSNSCPQDKYILDHLLSFTDDYIARQVSFAAINPNDSGQDERESFDKMRDEAQIMEFPFPYLFDPDQELAGLWQVRCTPEFFVFNREGQCLYRGAYDDAGPENEHKVTGKYLGEVLEALMAGDKVPYYNISAFGCPVLWRSIDSNT